MKFTYTCNNCPQLSLTEAEQDRLKLYGENRFHMCCKYGKRLFHWDSGKNHDSNIYPCSECRANMVLRSESMNFDNLVITKVVSADFWYHTCPNCGYKNVKELRVEVCPDCGTALKFGHMENIKNNCSHNWELESVQCDNDNMCVVKKYICTKCNETITEEIGAFSQD